MTPRFAYQGTWNRNLPSEVIKHMIDPIRISEEKLAISLRGKSGYFDDTCNVMFNYLADNWNNHEYISEFNRAIKDAFGEWTVFGYNEIGAGRRYGVWNKQTEEIYWSCDVYPK